MDMEWMELKVLGYTVKQLLIVGGGVVGFIIIVYFLKSLFKKKETDIHNQVVQCPECLWKGVVSRYAGRCPQCNRPLGEQKTRKYKK